MTKTNLVQTKSGFKFIGKVSRIDKDDAFLEESALKGKREGDLYRRLRFGIRTSPTNEMTVEMFDFEPKEVFLWNSEKTKEDPKYRGEKVPYEKWFYQQDEYREMGFTVLQTRVGLDYGKDGKLISHGLPSFVASETIYNNIDNGDSFVIEGEIRYSNYVNKNDETVEQKTYKIERIFRLKDIDFDEEKFEEVTYFEQEMVFVDANIDKVDKKVYVTGRVIDYLGNFHDTQMIVNFADEDGGNDDGMVKLATAFAKKFKFGDVINVFGNTVNRVITKEVQGEDSEEEDLLGQLGGKTKPNHAKGYLARTYVTEMSIEGVDAWDKKIYKESDFTKDELIVKEEKKENDLSSELGGKKKKESQGDNPFSNSTGDDDPFASDDDDDDDLPF